MPSISFYKEEDGRWYAYLPDYPGNKEDLEMVAGADTLLDLYAQGEESVRLSFVTELGVGSLANKPRVDILIREEELSLSGANYVVDKVNGVVLSSPLELWLCDVTLFLFPKGYPKKLIIYY